MILLDKAFDWQKIFFGKEHWDFLPQVILKTIVMFIVVLISLRLIGRRGIMQGVFQVLTIIMLGSAAGDPMLYSEVGLIPAALVFIMTVILYRIADFLVAKYSTLESYAEGRAVRVIVDNRFEIEHISKKELSKDEIFADLRKEGVSHLGQVKSVYMEAGGELSIFYRADEEVTYGLPLIPERYEAHSEHIPQEGYYACIYCGCTKHLAQGTGFPCPVCSRKQWVAAVNEKRIT
jgi:uncharacterized membrane protein YcaP (DUF421 family)